MVKKKVYKILLIDDDYFLLKMYATKFIADGFEVVVAKDGVEGLEMANKEMPDLILLDILMPKKSGLEVLGEMKKNKKIKDIPVILLTNINRDDETRHGMKLGAVDYLIKAHYIPSEIVTKAREHLAKNKK